MTNDLVRSADPAGDDVETIPHLTTCVCIRKRYQRPPREWARARPEHPRPHRATSAVGKKDWEPSKDAFRIGGAGSATSTLRQFTRVIDTRGLRLVGAGFPEVHPATAPTGWSSSTI